MLIRFDGVSPYIFLNCFLRYHAQVSGAMV